MSRVSDILERARDTLADPNKERWSDENLLRLLDEGQKDIARIFELLHGEVGLPTETNRTIYSLPANLWRIKRIMFNNIVLPMHSYNEMDCKSKDWMSDTGNKLEAVVFDNRNLQEIRVYPLPNDDFDITYYPTDQFGVVTEYLGATGDKFGVLSNLVVTPGETVSFDSPYGVLADSYTGGQIYVMYIRDPEAVINLASELELPPMFDTALKYYVIGNAFLNDLDTQYQEKGAQQIALYKEQTGILGTRAKERNGTRADNHRTTYRGFI